ncbi:MAG: hypothetical protein ACI835_003403 [Planctomycetota bacterium]|jgi:hypothetical protein
MSLLKHADAPEDRTQAANSRYGNTRRVVR